MIEATLTITARYLEGEKVDIPDVERVLQAAVEHDDVLAMFGLMTAREVGEV